MNLVRKRFVFGGIAMIGLLSIAVFAWRGADLSVGSSTEPAPLHKSAPHELRVGPDHGKNSGGFTSGTSEQSSPEPSPDALSLRLASCLSNPSDDERRLEFLKHLSQMTPGDAATFLSVLEDYRKHGVRREEWAAFWRKWGEVDPNAAVAYLDQHSSEGWSADSYQQVLRSWATKNMSQAQAWLNSHSDHPHFDQAFLGFLEGYATWDPNAATQTALASLGGSDRLLGPAMERISEAVFRSSFAPGLKQWFDRLPEGDDGVALRKAAMRHVYWRLLQENASTAAEWISAQANSPWRDDGIIAELASRMAAKDPAAAMQWVSSMTPSPRIGVVMGVGEIVQRWANNPATFEPWLESARGTQVFEQAARDYAILIAKKDPAKSLFWATQVSNPRWRGEALQAAHDAGAR